LQIYTVKTNKNEKVNETHVTVIDIQALSNSRIWHCQE